MMVLVLLLHRPLSLRPNSHHSLRVEPLEHIHAHSEIGYNRYCILDGDGLGWVGRELGMRPLLYALHARYQVIDCALILGSEELKDPPHCSLIVNHKLLVSKQEHVGLVVV